MTRCELELDTSNELSVESIILTLFGMPVSELAKDIHSNKEKYSDLFKGSMKTIA